MYKLPDGQMNIYTLLYPLRDMLNPENRWVLRANAVPWDKLERVLSAKLYAKIGAPAKPLRMMLGAMMNADTLKLSDAEAVRQIQENPYMQYFVGLTEFTRERLFSPSALKQFRRRITPAICREIRKIISGAEK
jgi:hypothetical protein